MCGIHFAISGTSSVRNFNEFLTDAFYANQVRGTDSSGMFQVDSSFSKDRPKEKVIAHFKKAVNGSEFLDFLPARDMLENANKALATICHVRAATHGAHDQDKNAHPFIATKESGGRIIGVHNGSLDLWKHRTGSDDYAVDSEWLYSKIAKDGTDALSSFSGAFALVWYDTDNPTSLFVARNDKRPLFYAYTKDRRGIIGCSELGMLGWLADRRGIELWSNKEGAKFFYFEPQKVYELDIYTPAKWSSKEFAEYKYANDKYVRPVTSTAMIPANPRSSRTSAWNDDDFQDPFGWNSRFYGKTQADVLGGIGDALRRVRNGIVEAPDRTDTEIVTQDALGQAIDKTLNDIIGPEEEPKPKRATGPATGPRQTFVSKPFSKSASKAEIARAKDWHVYGMVVNFVGYLYDEDTGETLGEFELRDDDYNITKHTAIIRGLTKARAYNKYIKPDKLARMNIVGVTERMVADEPYVILAEHNEDSVPYMMRARFGLNHPTPENDKKAAHTLH